MKELIKAYLMLLNRIQKKVLIREFYIWKYAKKIEKKESPVRKRISHATSLKNVQKFKSMTEKSLRTLINGNEAVESDVFEEIKSSLQNKAMKNEGKTVEELKLEQKKATIHKKNTFSSASLYTNKGSRKNLLKFTPDMLSSLAVVSSSSLNIRKEKDLLIFPLSK